MADKTIPVDHQGTRELNEYHIDDENYGDSAEEGDGSWDSYSGEEDVYEPEWTSAVTDRGDLFYVEPSAPEISTITAVSSLKHQERDKDEVGDSRRKDKKTIKKLKKIIGIKKNYEKSLVNNKNQNNLSHGVTFQDTPSGVTKEALIYVDPNRNNYGRKASLCESLLGIIPGFFSGKNDRQNGGGFADRRIMIQGLLPSGEAMKSGQVKIGDWLMSVDDYKVDFDNIDDLLASYIHPRRVKLLLQKFCEEAYITPPVIRKNDDAESLVKFVSGEKTVEAEVALRNLPHVIMYLTLENVSENVQDKSDLLYQYPLVDSKLVEVRGMFITLCHTLLDVTNNTAKNSTLIVDERLIHVGYKMEEKEVLIVALPATNVPLFKLNHLMDDIVRILTMLFGTLKSAFGKEENKDRLDHFFSLLCQRILLKDELAKQGIHCDECEESFLDALPGVRALSLPEDLKTDISSALSEFEAADFGEMSDDYYDIRRSYTILGSSLFHKGFLICNHLHPEDMMDIALYVKYYCLLLMSQDHLAGQVVIWKEITPTRKSQVASSTNSGFIEPDARWFLMIVGMKQNLLCAMLEAGGCAETADGNPPPDPFYVDQAKATLLHLDSTELLGRCESRLNPPSVPGLVCADWLFPAGKAAKEEHTAQSKVQTSPRSAAPKKSQPESILKKKKSPSQELKKGPGSLPESDRDSIQSAGADSSTSTPIMGRRPSQRSLGSEESGGSVGSTSLFRNPRGHRKLPSAFDLTAIGRNLPDGSDDPTVKLTQGAGNVLFHYVNVDNVDGVYICPSKQDVTFPGGTTHTHVIQNFFACCQNIKKVFEKTIRMKSRGNCNNNDKLGSDDALGEVEEQGVLFECTPANWSDSKKTPPSITYWVVGRLFFDPYPREFYVCFLDSTPQNLVELAFKISFGIAT
ncbi:protein inturned-like [Lineus longissimus]|uniref:protein inturned-like n=1 Tax=Lineus longissimus TaxID=88925 RepID=UPI002B4D6F0B